MAGTGPAMTNESYAALRRLTCSSSTPMMSDSFMMRSSSPLILTSVPDLHIDRDQLAGLVAAAWADGDDFALGGFFLGGIGNDDAAGGLLLGADALDDDTVVKRTKLHDVLLTH